MRSIMSNVTKMRKLKVMGGMILAIQHSDNAKENQYNSRKLCCDRLGGRFWES